MRHTINFYQEAALFSLFSLSNAYKLPVAFMKQ